MVARIHFCLKRKGYGVNGRAHTVRHVRGKTIMSSSSAGSPRQLCIPNVGCLENRLQRTHQGTDWDAILRHSPGMPAAEKHKLDYETPNYVISHAVEFAFCISSTKCQYVDSASVSCIVLYCTTSWHLRAARRYHCTTINYLDSSVRGYHDKTFLPFGVSPCPWS